MSFQQHNEADFVIVNYKYRDRLSILCKEIPVVIVFAY